MTGLFISLFSPDSRQETLAQLLARAGFVGATAQTAPGGKPYLRGQNGREFGLSITHLRKARPPQSFMAVAATPYLGIDTELWPQGPGDAAFLKAVAAPEDAELIARLAATGRDPGIFLWAAKEAALKASGEVMTDPRNIFVEPSINGHFCAATSRNSQKPVPSSAVRIWRFSAKGENATALLAVAISGDGAETARQNMMTISAPGLDLVAPY